MAPAPSDLWFRKMRGFFYAINYTKTEKLGKGDIDGMVQKFTRHSGIKDQTKLKEHISKIDTYWAIIFQGRAELTYREFAQGQAALLGLVKTDPNGADPQIAMYVDNVFALIDVDRKGTWSPKDLQLYMEFKCRDSFDRSEVDKLFKRLSGGRAVISKEDFFKAVKSFFLDQGTGIADDVLGELPPASDSRIEL